MTIISGFETQSISEKLKFIMNIRTETIIPVFWNRKGCLLPEFLPKDEEIQIKRKFYSDKFFKIKSCKGNAALYLETLRKLQCDIQNKL